MNSGFRIFLIVLIAVASLTLLLLVLSAILSKKKGKVPAPLKAFSLFSAIVLLAASIVTPLAHDNYIPVNLRYGRFESEDHPGECIKVHRDSISYYEGSDAKKQEGKWSLQKDFLTIVMQDGTEMEFKVRGLGTELIDPETNQLVFLYTSRD